MARQPLTQEQLELIRLKRLEDERKKKLELLKRRLNFDPSSNPRVAALNPLTDVKRENINAEIANLEGQGSGLLNANANMTPIPAGLLQRGVQGANNPYTPSYNQSNIVNDPRLKSAMENVYKPTMREKVGGFFDRVNKSFIDAAPIFAVGREFHKAGAPRQIGAPMQGDPYGAMIQIQQNNQQAENLANLRKDPRYAQFANLPDDLFIDAVKKQNDFVIENQLAAQNTYANIKTDVSSDELVQQLNETKKPIILSEYEERAHGNTEMAHGWENTANLWAGSISVPVTSRNLAKRTEEARAATVQYFNYVRGILVDDVGGKVTVFDKKQVNNQLPATFDDKGEKVKRFHSEGKALASYQGLRGQLTSQLRDAIALTQDPNTQDDKTVMRKANSKIDKLRKAIKLTDIRIASLNQERRGADAFYGERDDLFENPIDTSGYNGMTEEQAEDEYFGSLDSVYE